MRSQGLINASDGTSLYYEVQGEGKPLVFCYGLLCRREHWHHQMEYFAKDYRVISFDYRGHHFSSRPANDRHLTIEWCAKDLVSLFDHLELEEAVVLGHSLGVPVLSRFLPMLPDRVKGAVFVCGSVTNPFATMFHTNTMTWVHRASSILYDQVPGVMDYVWDKFTAKSTLSFLMTSRLGFNASRAQEKDVWSYMEGVHQTPFSTFHSLVSDYTQFDGRPYLASILTPTLLVAGEADHITPIELQEEMVSLLAKGRLMRLKEGSHNAHMDFPKEVNEEIARFLKEVGF